jgi:ribosomal-protein-alanine N-acetyltransferase
MLCAAAAGLKLRVLTAATSDENHASQRVLAEAGFMPSGPANPAEIGGKSGTRYRLVLPGEQTADPIRT